MKRYGLSILICLWCLPLGLFLLGLCIGLDLFFARVLLDSIKEPNP
jgi:hypothetical protein